VVDRPLVRRRTAVAGGLGGLVVLATGCDPGEDLAPPQADPSASSVPPSPEGSDQQTLDETLVHDVAAELLAAIGVLSEARRFVPLRPVVTPLLRAHRAHVRVLEVDGTVRTTSEVPASSAVALQQIRRSERQLRDGLTDAAGRAESGALARLLASMAASVTQHLAFLPAEA
jgi:hypothetical protein